MRMKKKMYEKPSLEVVVMNQQTALLQASVNSGQVNATMDGTFEEITM